MANWADRIRKHLRDPRNRLIYELLGGAILLGVGLLIGRELYAADSVGYSINVFTSVLGFVFTVGVLEVLARYRDKANATRELQRQLVDDAASTSNEIAKNAVHQLRRKGWLTGENGLLKGADLRGANLQDAPLKGANLQRAELEGTNLQEANIEFADLREANLRRAKLQNTKLGGANLQNALIFDTNFKGANLEGVKLQNTWLMNVNLENAIMYYAQLEKALLSGATLFHARLNGANLREADMEEAFVDETTILPDGTPCLSKADLQRFIDPEHPNFWELEQVEHQGE